MRIHLVCYMKNLILNLQVDLAEIFQRLDSLYTTSSEADKDRTTLEDVLESDEDSNSVHDGVRERELLTASQLPKL